MKNKVVENNKGQVTLFIIIALVVVALGILIYLFFPKIKTALVSQTESPELFIQQCLEPSIKSAVQTLALQGGNLEPELYIIYEGKKVGYTCYTEEYYKTCVVQQPMLIRHIQNEIETNIKNKVTSCFDDLEKNYQQKGYTVNLQHGTFVVELMPKRIVLTSTDSLTLTKTNTDKYDKFNVVLNNNLYELTSIANSITEWETRYGDAETTSYMTYYKDLKVEKKLQQDGTKIYILTDRNNGNKFQFASRSVVLPPGYGV